MAFPIVIVGAGPAGTAAALTLRRYVPEFEVVLVDREANGPARASPAVGETLSPGALPLLDYLGLRESFLGQRHLPALGTASAWGGRRALERDYLFSGMGHGWHLDRQRFDSWLRDEAVARGARLVSASVHEAVISEAGVELRVNGEHLSAGALIDATGRSARLARSLGARIVRDDRLVARARWYTREDTPDLRRGALVETLSEGWWYSAELPGGRGVQMLMTDPARLPRGADACEAFWQRCLAEAPLTRERTATWRATADVAVRPAHSQRLTQPCGERWVAVGDAALAFDPLASLGLGFALRAGMEGARVAAAACEHDSEPAAAYAASLERIYDSYRERLVRLYALERRWAGSGFWQRAALPHAA